MQILIIITVILALAVIILGFLLYRKYKENSPTTPVPNYAADTEARLAPYFSKLNTLLAPVVEQHAQVVVKIAEIDAIQSEIMRLSELAKLAGQVNSTAQTPVGVIPPNPYNE